MTEKHHSFSNFATRPAILKGIDLVDNVNPSTSLAFYFFEYERMKGKVDQCDI